MARTWRIEYAGACYHVINRGNDRKNLFLGKGMAEAFERTLGETAERFRWRVHAYVVMSNHFHLAVELTEPNLSEGMKWLQGTWIQRYNGNRRLIGRPFQGRYKALLVEPGQAFGQVCHYIHLNPVRARIVSPAKAMNYPWSSLRQWTAKPRPLWLEPSVVLGEAGELNDTPAGWKKYLAYLKFLATDELSRKTLVAENMSRGWRVGSRKFKGQMKQAHAKRGAEIERFPSLKPGENIKERAQRWEKRLRAIAKVAKIKLEKLPLKKSHPDKVQLAAALKQSSSVSNGWLARRLAMGEPASASQFVRRWLLTEAGRDSTTALLSRVKT